MRLTLAAALLAIALPAGTAAATTPPTSPPTTPATAPVAADTLRIIVTNDDGLKAPGIDVLVKALLSLDDVEVTVIAPANNQSGTGNNTTPGALLVVDSTTAGGLPGKAVGGFPADTVVWALDQGGYPGRPDLVISGINAGQNLGWVSNELSGTVGAARAAAARGIPALAVSQGLEADSDVYDFEVGAAVVLDWIAAHRQDLQAAPAGTPVAFTNINVPSCPAGQSPRGTLEIPGGTVQDTRPVLAPADCASTVTGPADDVDAFNAGYIAISVLAPPPPPG